MTSGVGVLTGVGQDREMTQTLESSYSGLLKSLQLDMHHRTGVGIIAMLWLCKLDTEQNPSPAILSRLLQFFQSHVCVMRYQYSCFTDDFRLFGDCILTCQNTSRTF